MARSDVYIQVGNCHTVQSIGGRRTSDSGWAWLNTDNASKSDCGLRVSVDVSGERQRNGRPLRKTCDCGHKWRDGYWDDQHNKWIDGEDEGRRECPQCGVVRQGIDTRKSHFTVKLPDQTDGNCEVVITTPHYEAERILQFGAMLCTLQGAAMQAEGVATDQPELVKSGRVRIKQAQKILAEHEAAADKALPNVILPGGVTLAHALACVKLVDQIVQGKAHRPN